MSPLISPVIHAFSDLSVHGTCLSARSVTFCPSSSPLRFSCHHLRDGSGNSRLHLP